MKREGKNNHMSVMVGENPVEGMKGNKLLECNWNDQNELTTIPWHRADPLPRSCARGTARACRPARQSWGTAPPPTCARLLVQAR